MFSHIMIGSNNLEKSKQFYNAVLGVLGVGEPFPNEAPSGHMRLFYRHEGMTFCVTQPINDQPASYANGGTIGFKCNSEEQVRAFHEAALAAGGTTDEAPPGLRSNAIGSLYLAYVRDPDGNKLCALYRPR